MQRDFKIGVVLGLVLMAVATLWLATRPSLSPEARVMRARTAKPRQNLSQQPLPSISGGNPTTEVSAVQPDEISRSAGNATVGVEPEQGNEYDSSVYEKDEKIKTRRFHIVRRDETLSAISAKYYGSANKWLRIFDANRSRIPDANRILPGTKLIIPD